MLKKILITVLLIFIIHYSLHITQTRAQSSVADEAQAEAAKVHKIALSDIIFVDEELKALYYQNIQIIELLKEIRSLLQQQLEQFDQKE